MNSPCRNPGGNVAGPAQPASAASSSRSYSVMVSLSRGRITRAGTPTQIDHVNAKFSAEQTGTAYAGWFSFQPLWDEVVRTDPDLFD